MIEDPRHVLTLGAVDFNDPDAGIEVMADSQNSWGSPQSVTAIVESLLADGSLVKLLRDDNRTVTFKVRIQATDSGELAWREAALVAELYRPNQLTWVPPDGIAPPSIFPVLMSSMEMQPLADGFDELLLRRIYTITLTCEPYVSSAESTTIEALASTGTGTVTSISSGSSLTGWSATTGVIATTGTVLTLTTGGYGTAAVYTFPTAQNMTTTPYVYLDVLSSGTTPSLRVNNGGTSARPMASYPSPDNAGYIRMAFYVGPVTAATLRFEWPGGVNQTFRALARATQPQVGSGSAHELLFSAPISGSRRAPASLRLYKAGSGDIGDALMFSGPDLANGFVPSLRRFASGGTTDAAAWSGKVGFGTNPQVPASLLTPGAYVMVLRVKSSFAVTQAGVTWTATMGSGGSTRAVSSKTYTDLSTSYGFVFLGGLVLPPIAVPPGSNQNATITFATTDGSLQIDDAWLMPLGEGSGITIIKSAKANVWVNAPTFDQPNPSVFTGADLPSALSAQNVAGSWDLHLVEPDSAMFYVASASTDARLSITYTKQWHTHAAE